MINRIPVFTLDENTLDPLLTGFVLLLFVLYSVFRGYLCLRNLQAGAKSIVNAAEKIIHLDVIEKRNDLSEVLHADQTPALLRHDLQLYSAGLIHRTRLLGADRSEEEADRSEKEIVSVASAQQVLRGKIVDESLQIEKASRLATHFVALSFALSVFLIAISLQVASSSPTASGGQALVLEFVGLKFLVTLAGLISAGAIRMTSQLFGDHAMQQLEVLRVALDDAFTPINPIAEMLAFQGKFNSDAELERASREKLSQTVDKFGGATESLCAAVDEHLRKRIMALRDQLQEMEQVIHRSSASFEARVSASGQSFFAQVSSSSHSFRDDISEATDKISRRLGNASDEFYKNMSGNSKQYAEVIKQEMETAGIEFGKEISSQTDEITKSLLATSLSIQQSWINFLGLKKSDWQNKNIKKEVLEQIEHSFGKLAEAAANLAMSVKAVEVHPLDSGGANQLVKNVEQAACNLRNAFSEIGPTVFLVERLATLAARRDVRPREEAQDDEGAETRRQESKLIKSPEKADAVSEADGGDDD